MSANSATEHQDHVTYITLAGTVTNIKTECTRKGSGRSRMSVRFQNVLKSLLQRVLGRLKNQASQLRPPAQSSFILQLEELYVRIIRKERTHPLVPHPLPQSQQIVATQTARHAGG